MIRMLITFASLYAILFFGIDLFRQMTGKERWSVIKTLIHAGVVSLLTVSILILIVILF